MKMHIDLSVYKKTLNRLFSIFLAVIILTMGPFQILNNVVYADQYDDRIAALKKDIEAYQSQAAIYSAQAKTLQVAISKLVSERALIQANLDISQAKYDQLSAEIASTEKKIADNRDALGKIIADLYVDDNISPIEMLAGSKNISDYMDKQEYRNSVRNELTTTIAKIKNLKITLENQKTEVKKVLLEQKTQRDALIAKENEQQVLLDKTKGDEASYQSLVAQSNSVIQQVKSEQAAYYLSLANKPGNVSNVSAGDPNKGGYPAYLANASQDSMSDPWGMYNRECVSYVAWKVYQAYGNMPYWGGIGNAWQWALSGWQDGGGRNVSYNTGIWHTANTQTYGIPSGTEPKVGSVAISSGLYGHAAWVEAVMGDNIKISQYNWYVPSLGGWGQYSEMIVSKSIFSRYIYFGEW